MSFSNGLNTCQSSRPSPCSACSLSGWSLWEYVVFCVSLWWVCFFCMLTVTRQSKEWNCRLLTLLHGSFVSYAVIRDIIVNGNQMSFQRSPLSDEQKGYLSFMLSYFVFDFMWIRFFGNESWIIQIHHVSSILVITKVMVSDYGGLGVLYGVVGLEITNPYLQIRWFLRTFGYLNRLIHSAVEIWFFFLFFLIRLVGGSILFYYMYSDMDCTMKFLGTSIYLVSLGFAWDITKYVKKKYWGNRGQIGVLPTSGRARSQEHPKSEAEEQLIKADGEDQSKAKSGEQLKEEGEDLSITESEALLRAESEGLPMLETEEQLKAESEDLAILESKEKSKANSKKSSKEESKDPSKAESKDPSKVESENKTLSETKEPTKVSSENKTISETEEQAKVEIQEQSKMEDKEEMLFSLENSAVKNFDKISGDEEIFFRQFEKTPSWAPSQLSQENKSENAHQ